MKIRRTILAKAGREHSHDLSQAVTVPSRMSAIHRGGDQEGHIGQLFASLEHNAAELSQDGLDAMRNRRRGCILKRGEEVGDAGEDADVGLGSQLTQGFSEDLDVTTRQQLGRLHQRIRATVDLVQMTPDV